jgi:hypothetical protein
MTSPQIESATEFSGYLIAGAIRPGDQLVDDAGVRFVVVERSTTVHLRLVRLADGQFCAAHEGVQYPRRGWPGMRGRTLSAIVRNTFFDPRRNMTTAFGDRLAGCMYDEQRAGPNGKHVHVWVPPGTTMDELRAIRATIVSERDLVCRCLSTTGRPSRAASFPPNSAPSTCARHTARPASAKQPLAPALKDGPSWRCRGEPD